MTELSMAVSVIMRTRNEARALPSTVAAIRAQAFVSSPEVIVVDSGSTDGTLETAGRLGVDRLIDVSSEPFSYGRSLNRGAAAAGGEVLVLLSAHACPAHDRWLARLVRPLDHPAVAGVYGAQHPWPDSWPPVALDYRRCYGEVPCLHRVPEQVFFSNANAAVRRSRWRDLPFDEDLPACEDQQWASSAVARGWIIAYEPEAAVRHSHNEGPLQLCRRRAREAQGWRRVTGQSARLRDALADGWERSRADAAWVRAGGGRWYWMALSPLYRFLWALSPWYPYG
jgi:rhamnosyltransferase